MNTVNTIATTEVNTPTAQRERQLLHLLFAQAAAEGDLGEQDHDPHPHGGEGRRDAITVNTLSGMM